MFWHLGLAPGGRVETGLSPDGKARLEAAKPKGCFQELQSFLKGKTNGARLSIEDINEAIAEAGNAVGAGQE